MRRTRIRQVSKRRAAVNRDRRELSKRLHDERGPWCQVRGPDCTGLAEGLHELVGRAQGGSLVDERNLLLACNRDNTFIEDRPAVARENGWKCPRWDAEPGVGGLVPSGSWQARNGGAG